MRNKFIIACIMVLNSGYLYPQNYDNLNQEFEISAGLSKYSGDLGAENHLRLTDIGYTFGFRYSYNFRKYASLSLGFNQSRIGAADANSLNEEKRIRNLDFRSNTSEFYSTINLLLPLKKVKFIPEVYAGIGKLYFNPEGYLDGKWYELNSLGTEGQKLSNGGGIYTLNTTELLYGARAQYIISNQLSIGAEVSFRKTYTDYLDDVSTTYPNLQELAAASGNLTLELSNKSLDGRDLSGDVRGNPNNDDTFFLFKMSLRIRFGGSIYTPNTYESELPCFTF